MASQSYGRHRNKSSEESFRNPVTGQGSFDNLKREAQASNHAKVSALKTLASTPVINNHDYLPSTSFKAAYWKSEQGPSYPKGPFTFRAHKSQDQIYIRFGGSDQEVVGLNPEITYYHDSRDSNKEIILEFVYIPLGGQTSDFIILCIDPYNGWRTDFQVQRWNARPMSEKTAGHYADILKRQSVRDSLPESLHFASPEREESRIIRDGRVASFVQATKTPSSLGEVFMKTEKRHDAFVVDDDSEDYSGNEKDNTFSSGKSTTRKSAGVDLYTADEWHSKNSPKRQRQSKQVTQTKVIQERSGTRNSGSASRKQRTGPSSKKAAAAASTSKSLGKDQKKMDAFASIDLTSDDKDDGNEKFKRHLTSKSAKAKSFKELSSDEVESSNSSSEDEYNVLRRPQLTNRRSNPLLNNSSSSFSTSANPDYLRLNPLYSTSKYFSSLERSNDTCTISVETRKPDSRSSSSMRPMAINSSLGTIDDDNATFDRRRNLQESKFSPIFQDTSSGIPFTISHHLRSPTIEKQISQFIVAVDDVEHDNAPSSLASAPFPVALRSALRPHVELVTRHVHQKERAKEAEDETNLVKSETWLDWRKPPGTILFTYPKDTLDCVSITLGDVKRLLAKDSFINDSLIDYALKMTRLKSTSGTELIHIFTSHLYSRFKHGYERCPSIIQGARPTEAQKWLHAYSQVWKWCSPDLFQNKLILFPINSGLHWSLVVVCILHHVTSNDNRMYHGAIFTLDSLAHSPHNPEALCEMLRKYLNHELHFKTILGIKPKERKPKETGKLASASQPIDEEEDDDDLEIVEGVDDKEAGGGIPGLYSQSVGVVETQFDERNFPLYKIPVPEQTDGVNCGLHLLNNAETFLVLFTALFGEEKVLNAEDAKAKMYREVLSQFRTVKFTTDHANGKRQDIKEDVRKQLEIENQRAISPSLEHFASLGTVANAQIIETREETPEDDIVAKRNPNPKGETDEHAQFDLPVSQSTSASGGDCIAETDVGNSNAEDTLRKVPQNSVIEFMATEADVAESYAPDSGSSRANDSNV